MTNDRPNLRQINESFLAWFPCAYRDPYSPDARYTPYTMEVAYTAGHMAALAQDRAARAQAEPAAWQWRKRQTWFAGKPDETSFWSEWEALQPPYMDARDLAKSDPANYEIRPLYAATRAQGAGEAVAWRPMETAPMDGTPILALCQHTGDAYYDGDRLTAYGARAEGLSHVEDGPHVIVWGESYEVSDGWESPSFTMPAGWELSHDCEVMANPVGWIPIPATAPTIPQATPPVQGDQPTPAGFVFVPREVLQAASESLGSFVSDHGWSQHDMDVMDAVDAALAAAPQVAHPQPLAAYEAGPEVVGHGVVPCSCGAVPSEANRTREGGEGQS